MIAGEILNSNNNYNNNNNNNNIIILIIICNNNDNNKTITVFAWHAAEVPVFLMFFWGRHCRSVFNFCCLLEQYEIEPWFSFEKPLLELVRCCLLERGGQIDPWYSFSRQLLSPLLLEVP